MRTANNPDLARAVLTYGARRGAGFVVAGVLDQLQMQSAFAEAGAAAGMKPRDVLEVVRHELHLARRRTRARRS